jgi:large subunit ribosomal protein L1
LKIDKKIENLRGVVNLPAGSAKEKKVLEVTEKNVEEIVEKVKAGKAEFDIILATPAVMPKLAVLAKILGPKGLMPNPKSGTVTENITEVAEEFHGGKIEFKADKGNNIHISIGKVSRDHDKIKENLDAVLAAVPIGKVLSAHLTTSMGPSIKIKVGK